jgi:AcrR family transcriptional regulator
VEELAPKPISGSLPYRSFVVDDGGERPRPGRGGRLRDPQVDEAITAAARALLEERGIDGTTIDAIARRAGVARATVYRRWPNKDALIAQLIRDLKPDLPVADRGCVRAELVELLAAQLAALQGATGHLYPALGAHAAFSPAAAAALKEVVDRRRCAVLEVLRRGIQRAEIREDFDLDLGLCLTWGPLYYRFLGFQSGAAPIERDFVERLVDSLLAGIGTARSGSR